MYDAEEHNMHRMVATNRYQGDDTRVVCVCTVGSLRSQTLCELLVKKGGYNPRACGTEDYAIVPLSRNLLYFHEVIFCMEYKHLQAVHKLAEQYNIKVTAHVLGVEDDYCRNQPELVDMLETRLQELGYV